MYLQNLEVNKVCEDHHGYPAIVAMVSIPKSGGRYRFSSMDYESIVRQLVQGLEDGEDEWSTRRVRRKLTRRSLK